MNSSSENALTLAADATASVQLPRASQQRAPFVVVQSEGEPVPLSWWVDAAGVAADVAAAIATDIADVSPALAAASP